MSKILQPTFLISDDIAAGLASGIYKRTGGVIRNSQTGEIVEHLKDGLQKDTVKDVTPEIVSDATSNSVGLSAGEKVGIGVLVVAAVAVASYGAYKLYGFIKKKRKKNAKIEKTDLIGYNPEITEYLNATNNKTMSLDKVIGVVKFFELYSSGKNVNIEISNDELLTLRNIFVKYAIALSEVNHLESPNLSIEAKSNNREDLLEECMVALRYQKDLFENEK